MARNVPLLTATERAVLVAVQAAMAAVAELPEPPEGDFWARNDWDELVKYGPRYKPAEWFGGGRPLPERHRVAYLRAVHRLIGDELLDGTTGERGRLAHLKLTADGVKAIRARKKA